MFSHKDNEFECFRCGSIFTKTVFGIKRGWERVYYKEKTRMVSVESSLQLGGYCSASCRDADLPSVMQREGVPILRPGFGPIEVCAKRRGPVDMSRSHMTYVEDEFESDGLNSAPVDVTYVAVVCQRCDPTLDSHNVDMPASTDVVDEKTRKQNSATARQDRFTPVSFHNFRGRANLLRKAIGTENLSQRRAYELFAQLCGYRSFYHIQEVLLSEQVPPTIFDWQLDESQLRSRRLAQITVLVDMLTLSETEAAELLEAGAYTSSSVKTAITSDAAKEIRRRTAPSKAIGSHQTSRKSRGTRSFQPRRALSSERPAYTFDNCSTELPRHEVKVVYRKHRTALVAATPSDAVSTAPRERQRFTIHLKKGVPFAVEVLEPETASA